MEILEIILPVLVMVALGMGCRKRKLLNQNGIDNMNVHHIIGQCVLCNNAIVSSS